MNMRDYLYFQIFLFFTAENGWAVSRHCSLSPSCGSDLEKAIKNPTFQSDLKLCKHLNLFWSLILFLVPLSRSPTENILLQNVTKPVLTSWGSVLPGQVTNCVPLCPTVYFFLPVRYIRPTTTAGVNTANWRRWRWSTSGWSGEMER